MERQASVYLTLAQGRTQQGSISGILAKGQIMPFLVHCSYMKAMQGKEKELRVRVDDSVTSACCTCLLPS